MRSAARCAWAAPFAAGGATRNRRDDLSQALRPGHSGGRAMVDGQAGDIGSVAFDVADRLAIINLFGAYAYSYDENRLDEFRELFPESPELGLKHSGPKLGG